MKRIDKVIRGQKQYTKPDTSFGAFLRLPKAIRGKSPIGKQILEINLVWLPLALATIVGIWPFVLIFLMLLRVFYWLWRDKGERRRSDENMPAD